MHPGRTFQPHHLVEGFLQRVDQDVGFLVSLKHRINLTISAFDLWRSRAGTNDICISPRAAIVLRQPGPTDTTEETSSGTSGSVRSVKRRACLSTSASRVPTSISPVTRTSPSSLGGRYSVPING